MRAGARLVATIYCCVARRCDIQDQRLWLSRRIPSQRMHLRAALRLPPRADHAGRLRGAPCDIATFSFSSADN